MITSDHGDRISSGGYVIDDNGFHRKMGTRRKPDFWHQSIDEFLVALRTTASAIIAAAASDDDPDSGIDGYMLATDFRALDDWLSSGRRRLPKAWWTTTEAQEPEGL